MNQAPPDPAPGSLLQRWRQRLWRGAPADKAPVVLRHSRIYIVPTRRGLALLGTLAIMLLTSLNYSLSLGFIVTFLLAGVVASALLHTFRNLSGVAVRPLVSGEAFAGGTLPFVITLAGGSGIRRGFRLTGRDAASQKFDVPPGVALPVTLHRVVPKRGRVPIGRVTISSDYPIGVWRAWAYVHFPLEGIVYPAPEPNAPPLPPGREGHHTLARASGQDEDLAGLREYQPGDPLQRVAWKAVARGAGWHSKQFEGAGGGGPVILDWSSLPEGMGGEARVGRLTAWVLAAERATRPFGLSLPGAHLPIGQGRDQRRAALTALALLPEQEA